MNLYLPNNRRVHGRTALYALSAVVVIFTLVDFLSGGWIRSQLRGVFSVGAHVSSAVQTTIADFKPFSTRAALIHENESLKQQLAQQTMSLASERELSEEVQSLRSLVRIASHEPGVAAPVISSLSASPYGTFLIGSGEVEGIQKNAVVVIGSSAENGEVFAIGEVVSTTAHTALVHELFAPGASLEALVASIPITLTGTGGGNAQARAPRGAQVVAGDVVVLPRLANRPIGIVGKVTSDPAQSYTEVLVRTPLTIGTVRNVFVLPPAL